jgi:hypothetical protein
VQRADEIDRIEIEGRFGTAKRRYGLARIMTKLAETSEHAIALVFVVMNLDKILRDLLLPFFRKLFEWLFFSIKPYCWLLDTERELFRKPKLETPINYKKHFIRLVINLASRP